MRLFLSKAIAGGLSAGVVLLWWPLLFPADTVGSWLIRGVVWTVLFELLLVAVGPLETALWETRRGERLATRARAAESRLRSGSPRRTFARLSAIAAAAVAVPAAMLAAGLSEATPSKDAPRQVRVVEVTKVVRPVTVKKVQRVVAPAPAPTVAVSSPVPVAEEPDAPRARPERKPVKQTAPKRKTEPAPEAETPASEPVAPKAEPEDSGQEPAATGSST